MSRPPVRHLPFWAAPALVALSATLTLLALWVGIEGHAPALALAVALVGGVCAALSLRLHHPYPTRLLLGDLLWAAALVGVIALAGGVALGVTLGGPYAILPSTWAQVAVLFGASGGLGLVVGLLWDRWR